MKWERFHGTSAISWRGTSPRFGQVELMYARGTKKWYLMTRPFTGSPAVLGVYTSKREAQDVAEGKKNPPRGPRRHFTALKRAGVTVTRVNARGRRATRKRNPIPRGRALGDRAFTLSTLRAVKQGGRAEKIWYEDARDGKHYYHDFDGAQGAVMYLCESAAVGKCVLIVSGDLATPLWEDA